MIPFLLEPQVKLFDLFKDSNESFFVIIYSNPTTLRSNLLIISRIFNHFNNLHLITFVAKVI